MSLAVVKRCAMEKARAYVELIRMKSEGQNEAEAVHLVVQYDGKEARLEIPAGAPLFEREPGVDVYRRELADLISALHEVADSPEGIYWPHHR